MLLAAGEKGAALPLLDEAETVAREADMRGLVRSIEALRNGRA
jgi:hypothetical protein